ncbi:MAG: ATP-binding protein [Bacteroidota bacterium]
MDIIGRKKEIQLLNNSLKTKESELIAVYGRRRVGKTFLIREVCKKNIVFEVTGLYNGSKQEEIAIFFSQLKSFTSIFDKRKKPGDWQEAFELLKEYIDTLKGSTKKVLFFDELPWLCTHKSNFLSYLGHFWNTHCEKRKDLTLVVCGSAASFMVKKVIKDKGSLHARLSYKIKLEPFNLYETKQFLKSKNVNYTNYDIVQLYLAIGGIPHYLSKIEKGLSVVQNIQELCFTKDGILSNEFEEIFVSLFSNSEIHIKIVKALSVVQQGITRSQLLKETGLPTNGKFSDSLNELMASGFVSEYIPYGKKTEHIYRLSDEYSLFYLRFIQKNKYIPNVWQNLSKTQSYKPWTGFAFETICLKHVAQLKSALKIAGIRSVNYSWKADGAQIDLLIDRDDNIINICEMKFYNAEYTIDKKEEIALRNKIAVFENTTKTKKNIHLTLVTTYGVKANEYFHSMVNNDFTIDVLFKEIDAL